MTKSKINKIIWLVTLIPAVVAVLGEYGWVTVKGLTKYDFEILLAAFIVLALARLFKR